MIDLPKLFNEILYNPLVVKYSPLIIYLLNSSPGKKIIKKLISKVLKKILKCLG